MVKTIIFEDKLLAIIIPSDYSNEGIEFFTPNEFSQQLAYMHHPSGKQIDAHTHNMIPRDVRYTKEVLIVRKGRLRIDFYDDHQMYIESHVISAGDVVLLAYGGHGFECLEEVEMLEVKQGPYLGDKDKIRFPGVDPMKVKIHE